MADDFETLRHRDDNLHYFGEEYRPKYEADCESCGRTTDVQAWTDGALVLSLCADCRAQGRRDEEALK